MKLHKMDTGTNTPGDKNDLSWAEVLRRIQFSKREINKAQLITAIQQMMKAIEHDDDLITELNGQLGEQQTLIDEYGGIDICKAIHGLVQANRELSEQLRVARSGTSEEGREANKWRHRTSRSEGELAVVKHQYEQLSELTAKLIGQLPPREVIRMFQKSLDPDIAEELLADID